MGEKRQGRACAGSRLFPQAGRRRHQRRRARRWPGDRLACQPPDRRRRPERRGRPARGHPRPAARRRRRHPHGADARHPVRADGRAAPGHALQARAGQGEGPRRRAGRDPRRAGPGREGVDQGQPRRRARTRGTRPATRCPAVRRSSPALAAFLPAFPAMLRKQTKGAVYPAARAILSAAIEGAQVDFDTACGSSRAT